MESRETRGIKEVNTNVFVKAIQICSLPWTASGRPGLELTDDEVTPVGAMSIGQSQSAQSPLG